MQSSVLLSAILQSCPAPIIIFCPGDIRFLLMTVEDIYKSPEHPVTTKSNLTKGKAAREATSCFGLHFSYPTLSTTGFFLFYFSHSNLVLQYHHITR